MRRGTPILLLAALLAASTACAGPTTSAIGAAILDQIFPGSGAIAPLAGQLVTSQSSRTEEYAADAPKEAMIDTLTWLMQVSGSEGGGFFATHPGTVDRIDAIRKIP